VKVARNGQQVEIHYFQYRFDHDMDRLTLRRNDDDDRKVEGEGLAWFTAEEIHHLVIRPEDRVALDYFFRTHGI
jgi:hypothetical protein